MMNFVIKQWDSLDMAMVECSRPLKTPFELHTHAQTGDRISFRESTQVHLRLQKNSKFPNGDQLIPLFWQSEHYCVAEFRLYRFLKLEKTSKDFIDGTVAPLVECLWRFIV